VSNDDDDGQVRDRISEAGVSAKSIEAAMLMLLTRHHITSVVFCTALLSTVVSQCPFNHTSSTSTIASSSGTSGVCRCNRLLHEISCTDLDTIPDFSTPADDDYVALYVRRGTIRHVGQSAFTGLPRLAKLVIDLQQLNVGGLDDASFHWDQLTTSPLRELSVGASRVRVLPASLLQGLGQLRRLSVWGNEIDRLPGQLFDPVADSLIELSLWGNQLERVDESTFDVAGRRYWPALRSLDLDRNLITWLGRDSFRSMPYIETLRLAGNRVAALSADALSGLSRLRSLRLEQNGLGFIHGTAFVALESLLSLSLGDNALAFLPDGLFEPLGRLVDLRLQNNRLEYVWWRTFRGLRSLRRIDLSGNRLSNLPDDVFRHSTHLSVLAFDANNLRTLRRCSLPPVDSPQAQAQTQAGWSRARRRRTLSLLGNASLRCDCRLAWLATQIDHGVTAVWGSCDVALDPPSSSLTEAVDVRCPIVAVVLRQRFDVCPSHTRHQNNCKA